MVSRDIIDIFLKDLAKMNKTIIEDLPLRLKTFDFFWRVQPVRVLLTEPQSLRFEDKRDYSRHCRLSVQRQIAREEVQGGI